MNIGLGIGIPFNRSQIWLSLFDPSKLFTSGVNGAWYDPSDINLTWRRNLLTYSEQFDNAVWDKTSLPVTVTADVIAAPKGTNTADLVVPTAASAAHAVRQTGLSVGTSASFSVYAKSAGYDRVQLYLQNTGGFGHITFSLASGTVTNTVSGSVTVTGSITSAGNGWYLLSVAGAGATTVSVLGIIPLNAAANGATLGPVYAGDGTSGIYIWGAQLEVGSTATPYQRITDGIQDYLQYQPLPVMYRDAAGTLPVTAVEQPVGLMLDKSKGLVPGPELVTNGDFSNGTTGWSSYNADSSISVSSSELTISISAIGTSRSGGAQQTLSLVVGKTYQVIGTIRRTSGDSVSLNVVNNAQSAFVGRGTDITSTTTTQVSVVFTATETNNKLYARCAAASGAASAVVDNISVRELPGNHAFNPSGNSANFPVLSARYNLLTKTEQFDDAVWVKYQSATVSPNFGDAPDGTGTADLLTWGTGIASGVYQSVGSPFVCSMSLCAKAYSGSPVIGFGDDSGTRFALFNLSTGSVVSSTGMSSTAVASLGNGWYRLTAVFATAPSNIKFITGNGTVGSAYIWGADLRVANDALNQPAYQRVNTATDYDTVGFKPYVRFNGVNQWLQTNSIDFSYSDKMFVSAGVRKLSDAAGMVLETSANYNSNNGAIILFTDTKVNFGESGTGGNAVNSSGYTAPVTHVISATADRAGTTGPTTFTRLGVNGLDNRVSYAYVDNDAGNFGNYPLYIGARAGSSLWFNGRLYGMVVAGKQASAAEIQDTEKYMNLKTTAYN